MWPGPLLIFLYLALTEKSLDTPDLEDRSRRENLLLFNLKEGLEKDTISRLPDGEDPDVVHSPGSFPPGVDEMPPPRPAAWTPA